MYIDIYSAQIIVTDNPSNVFFARLHGLCEYISLVLAQFLMQCIFQR